MTEKTAEKKKLTIGKVVLILLIAVFVFIMVPRRQGIKDGGSVYYDSGLGGFVYSVKKLNEFVSERENNYLRKGIRIYVFGKVIYEDSYIDYDHPLSPSSDPQIDEVRRKINSKLGITESESEVPSNRVSSAIKK